MDINLNIFYCADDPNCKGDYAYVIIKDASDGEELARYGDHYHDKGLEKAGGFIDALRWAFGTVSVKTCHFVDEDYV